MVVSVHELNATIKAEPTPRTIHQPDLWVEGTIRLCERVRGGRDCLVADAKDAGCAADQHER